jgi:hypothetical protein
MSTKTILHIEDNEFSPRELLEAIRRLAPDV